MTTHARLSPSKRNRWALCPGSIREEAKYPPASSGPAAADGTHSHTLLEYCIKHKLIGPLHMIGHTMTDKEGEFKIDQDRAKRVEVAIDYIRSRVNEYNGLCEVLSEEQVNPEWLVGRPDMFGTVDCQLWGGNIYELIDYKDGMSVVEAEGNHQLEQYAYGVLSRFKLQPGELYPFDTIRMTIIQPKLALKGMKAIVSVDVPVTKLLENLPKIINEAAETDLPDATLVPGEKQCKFCQHKGSCSALAGNVMKEVGLMFQPVNVITQPAMSQQLDLAQQSANKDPLSMSDEQLAQTLEAIPLLKQFIKGAEEEAQRRMEAGQTVPGFKLVRGRGSRDWALPDEEMAERLKKMGIPKDALYEVKLISPSKAEKVEWVKKDGTKVQLSEKQLQRLDKEYITKSSGKIVIAPESDSREAVITNAEAMFAPVAPLEIPAWLL